MSEQKIKEIIARRTANRNKTLYKTEINRINRDLKDEEPIITWIISMFKEYGDTRFQEGKEYINKTIKHE